MATRRTIYLHGLASSPQSHKASLFRLALAQRGLSAVFPDLNQDDFEGLTISRMLSQLNELSAGLGSRSVLLVGSSLGGYTAALFAAQSDKVAAMVLLAPAFDFARLWRQRLGPDVMLQWQREGVMKTHHYATDREELIGWSLYQDARGHEPYPHIDVPALVLHGRADDVVDHRVSVRFAAENHSVQLELLDADHTLADVSDEVVQRSMVFMEHCLGFGRPSGG